MIGCDAVVVGAGMAGASAAAELASEGLSVVVLEAEPSVARHTTGRSAAVFTENYGNAVVRALTIASEPFLAHPAAGFTDVALLAERGAMWIGREDQGAELDALAAGGASLVPDIVRIGRDEVLRRCPVLSLSYVAGGVWEPGARDIDVDALLRGYLRQARRSGAVVRLSAALVEAEPAGDRWRVRAGDGGGEDLDAGLVVDAAGAWGDEVARRCGVAPIGLRPLRRTAFVFDPPGGGEVDVSGWPLVIDASEGFYFKPEGGRLLGSLADETPSEPCDARPEEIDVALALDRIGTAFGVELTHASTPWAGLRTFAPDRTPVVGADPSRPGFFWLAGQGGYGIQSAPALARALSGLVVDGRLPDDLLAHGLTPEQLSPDRFPPA